MMEEALIVIPYLAKDAQGSELELAVTGWRKHFKDAYHIVVAGDYHPVVESGDDISFVECPRIAPVEGQYLPHLDIANKFVKVREAFPDAEGFVYTCDDIYAVRDFSLDDVKADKIYSKHVPGFDWKKEHGWWRDLGKTAALCRGEGLPDCNWVCHLPVYYEWAGLLGVIGDYGCLQESYILENIYFNKFSGYSDEARNRPQQVGYHMAYSPVLPSQRLVDDLMGRVTWFSNSNTGWSEKLEALLREHYDRI